jgi:hypothetical protein
MKIFHRRGVVGIGCVQKFNFSMVFKWKYTFVIVNHYNNRIDQAHNLMDQVMSGIGK